MSISPTSPTSPPSAHASSVGLPADPAADLPSRRLLDELFDSREELIELLEFATFAEPGAGGELPADEDSPTSASVPSIPSAALQLLRRLRDPRLALASGRPVALTTLMREAGMTLPEMIDLRRRRDIALAIARSGRHLGEVIDGLGQVSKARWKICERCLGEGSVEHPDPATLDADEGEERIELTMPCPALCENGKVLVAGNLEAAKLFMGVHGLGPKGGGGSASVAVNVNAQAQAGAKADASSSDRDARRQEQTTSRVQRLLESGDEG